MTREDYDKIEKQIDLINQLEQLKKLISRDGVRLHVQMSQFSSMSAQIPEKIRAEIQDLIDKNIEEAEKKFAEM